LLLGVPRINKIAMKENINKNIATVISDTLNAYALIPILEMKPKNNMHLIKWFSGLSAQLNTSA
jgi:hypothetical protein